MFKSLRKRGARVVSTCYSITLSFLHITILCILYKVRHACLAGKYEWFSIILNISLNITINVNIPMFQLPLPLLLFFSNSSLSFSFLTAIMLRKIAHIIYILKIDFFFLAMFKKVTENLIN